MKILLTPLIEETSSPSQKRNPSDIRRIDLLAKNLTRHGYECYVREKNILLEQHYDVVITQSREYAFWLKNKEEIRSNVNRFIFTCSDAIGGTYSLAHNASSGAKTTLEKSVKVKNKPEFDFLEDICDLIIVGSDAQKGIIENLGVSTEIVVIEDFIDKDTYHFLPKRLPKQPISIFWEGYIDNVPYLENCAEAIKTLSTKYNLKVYLLTSRERRSPYLGTTDNKEAIAKLFGDIGTFIEWNDANVQKYMSKCHIGIAPLFQNDAFAMAKPANKLIIYNYMGLYAVASPTLAYEDYMKNGGVGEIVQDNNWEAALEKAFNQVASQDLRSNAHAHSEKYFSDDALIKKYIDSCQLEPFANNKDKSVVSNILAKQHFNTDSLDKKSENQTDALPHVAYLLPCIAISGGIAVVLKHANLLVERGYKVTIVSKSPYEGDDDDWFQCNAPIVNLEKKNRGQLNDIDILIATSWNTLGDVLDANVPRKIYFVQSDERRFVDEPVLTERIHQTYLADIEYMTEAVWIQRWLKDEFDHDAYYVPNGLDTSIFFPVQNKESKKKKRVLIEGAIDFPYKGMVDAYNAVKDLDCELWIISSRGEPPEDWRYDKFFSGVPMNEMKDIYSECDVFLKMSRVEGFFGPPLEAMACKCPVVVGKCTGYDEYIKDEVNALVVELGDIEAAKKAVNRLLTDEALRSRFIKNGLQTVQDWSWEKSANYLEKAILDKGIEVLYTDSFPEKYTYDPDFNKKINMQTKLQTTEVEQGAIQNQAEEALPKLTRGQRSGVTLFSFLMAPFLSSQNKYLIKQNPQYFFRKARHPVSIWVGKTLGLR